MTFQLDTAVILTGELFHFGTHLEKNKGCQSTYEYEFNKKSMAHIQRHINNFEYKTIFFVDAQKCLSLLWIF